MRVGAIAFEELASAVPEIVASLPDIGLVYLFGSRAQGTDGPLSDCDLGVWVTSDATMELRMRLHRALASVLGDVSLDLVFLNDAPIELAYAIIAQGKLLYQRDLATRVEVEANIMGRYGDYLPVLRAQRSEILQGEQSEARVQRYRAALGRTERTLGEIRAAQGEDAGRV